MALDNCENVWRVVNDGVETIFFICIRPFYTINSSNNTFNFTNSSSDIIMSNISEVNESNIILDSSPSSENTFSIYTPSSSNIVPSSNVSPSSIISQVINNVFPSSMPSTVPSTVPSVVPSSMPNAVPSTAPSVVPSVVSENIPSIDDIQTILNNSSNLTSNFSLTNHTQTIINDDSIILLSILIPLWFIFTSAIMYLYCKKRKSGTVIPCHTPSSKKKHKFNRPKDYLLEIIPVAHINTADASNNEIPELEKPPPVPLTPRPKLFMLKESLEEEEEKEDDEVEVINVAYGVNEKKITDNKYNSS